MSPHSATPARRKSPTQPLAWDWVSDWASLDRGLSALEAQHALDQADGESLERD